MKILHLTNFYTPHIGGVETHVSALVQQHVQHGHRVTVITNQHHTSLALREQGKGIEIVRLPEDIKDSKVLVWMWFFARRKYIASFDIIHVHDIFWCILPIYPYINNKIYITFHGWETVYPIPFTAKLQRYIYAALARGSIHIGDWIQEFYWDTPTFVSYGGTHVPQKVVTPFPQKKHLNCIFVGRLSEDNAVQQYIAVVERIKDSGWEVDMTWVGDGSYRDECLKVGTVTGFVADVSKYLVKAEYVFASSYLAMLEAQSHGKVVCATYLSVLKQRYIDSFPGKRHMITFTQPQTLATAIMTMKKQTFEKLSKEAYMFATQHTWEKVTEMYEQLWSLNR